MPKEILGIKMYRIHEVTEALGINIVTARRMFRQKRLRGRKIGGQWMISERSLMSYLHGEDTGE